MGDDIERVSQEQDLEPVSMGEIDAEDATALPNKEVMSLLDVNANVDLGLDLAAPVDLAVAANLNVAAPIEAAAGANLLSDNAEAVAVAQQHGTINQGISGSAEATAPQHADIDQGEDSDAPAAPAPGAAAEPAADLPVPPVDPPTDLPVPPPTDPGVGAGVGSLLQNGSLLDADININADADITAPINGAVAANANIAAPIDAAVSANILSPGSTSLAVADQDSVIVQTLQGIANATADQTSTIEQGETMPGGGS